MVTNILFKFHDDPTVNESKIVIFLRQVWWPAGKTEGFERRREKNENEGKMRHRRSETDLTSLFILRVHTTYY